jgi:hypothetical protein
VLLSDAFADPALNLTLKLFLRMISDFFRSRLVSVVLYGSVVLDDLAPGYGDLDFLAVVDRDLTEESCDQLCELRKPLRSGAYGTLAAMLEGAFLPRRMIDPAHEGRALWWGTSGERMWQRNALGPLVLHVIREAGLTIWGEDVRAEIPIQSREALLEDVRAFCGSARQHGRGGQLHSIDWLLTASRLLLWLREDGRLSSKSEAADWGYRNARGDWRRFLPRSRELRLHPEMAERAEVQAWLGTLTGPIQEVVVELEREMGA